MFIDIIFEPWVDSDNNILMSFLSVPGRHPVQEQGEYLTKICQLYGLNFHFPKSQTAKKTKLL